MNYSFPFVALIVLLGCNETKDLALIHPGFDYYPVKPGEIRVYEVTEIFYRLGNNDTSRYFLREYITDSIVGKDQTTYLFAREKKDVNSSESAWEVDSVWSFALTANYLSITENNVPYMKLTFPIRTTAEWNGNSLNNRTNLTYYYETPEQALIDSIAVEDHIKVIIEDIVDTIVIGSDLRNETYARGVGLAEKDYFTQVLCTAESQCEDPSKFPRPVISGRSLKQTLIAIE